MSTRKRPKKQPQKDWHVADIKAALEKKEWSLSQLSQHHGYSRGALKNVLYRRWPKGQKLIAEAIGVEPAQIWPSRYQENTPAKRAKPVGKAA